MSNLFLDLPVPDGNGVGPWIDVSKLGGDKTIKFALAGSKPFIGSVTIEAVLGDNDEAYAGVCQFTKPGRQTLKFAAKLLRVRIKGHKVGGGYIQVAGDSRGSRFVNLPIMQLDGAGPSVDVTGFGAYTTVMVSHGKWTGAVNIQVSDDDENFSDVVTFANGGIKSFELQGRYLRARRSGVHPASSQYQPRVDAGAVNDASDAVGIEINGQGKFISSRQRVNFVGAGVAVRDDPENDCINVEVPGKAIGDSSIILWMNLSIGAGADTRYMSLGGGEMASLSPRSSFVVPRPGTFKNLVVRHNKDGGRGHVKYQLFVNGEPTALSVSNKVNGVGHGGDTINAVAVKKFDVIDLVASKNQPIGTGELCVVASVEFD